MFSSSIFLQILNLELKQFYFFFTLKSIFFSLLTILVFIVKLQHVDKIKLNQILCKLSNR